MRELNPNLIRGVSAQADAIAQPTFATDVDFSTPGGGTTPPPGDNTPPPTDNPPPNNQAGVGEIALVTPQQICNQDDTFTVEIKIDSQTETLKSYTVNVRFDPNLVQVVDNDTSLTGIQIEPAGDFNVTTNTVSNTTGLLSLTAESSTAVAVDGVVGKITFKAIAKGGLAITINDEGSSLVDNTSADILDKVTGVNLTIGDNCIDTSSTPPPTITPPTPGQGVGELPKSDLPFSGTVFLLAGIGLVYLGILGRRISKQQKHR